MLDRDACPPVTWEENALPTAEQLYRWLRAFTDDHDERQAVGMLRAMLEDVHRGIMCQTRHREV